MSQIATGIFYSKTQADDALAKLREQGITEGKIVTWEANSSESKFRVEVDWPGWSGQLGNLGASAGSIAGGFFGLALSLSLWPWVNINNTYRQYINGSSWTGWQQNKGMTKGEEKKVNYQVWIKDEKATEAAQILTGLGADEVKVGIEQAN